MVLHSGDAGADRDPGIRSRSARQQEQDGRWRPVETDTCLSRRYNNGMRVESRVRRVVHISLRVPDGRGSWYTEGEGGGSINTV